MEQIQPIKWNPDKPEATQIQVWNSSDDLESQCTFGWQLLTDTGATVDTGSIFCTGVDYLQWDGNRQWPYNYVCNFLGLTLI
jgi:hypothetical protein